MCAVRHIQETNRFLCLAGCHDFQPRPARLITFCLALEQVGLAMYGIDPKQALLDIAQAVGCVDLARDHIQPDAGAGNKVAINAVFGRFQSRIGPPESLFVPKMDAGLVLDIDVDAEVLEKPSSGLDNLVFSFPGGVIVEWCCSVPGRRG